MNVEINPQTMYAVLAAVLTRPRTPGYILARDNQIPINTWDRYVAKLRDQFGVKINFKYATTDGLPAGLVLESYGVFDPVALTRHLELTHERYRPNLIPRAARIRAAQERAKYSKKRRIRAVYKARRRHD